LERTPEGELLPMAQDLGIGVLPWSPLRGGQLSGKYTRNNGTPADSRRIRMIEGPTESDWTVIEDLAALDEPSTPSLDFPAAVITEMSPMFGFGGATVDGVELPLWPQLRTSSTRY
jgi:aryl-alcohol dehydrogenase-like predicted oxidoreductase